MSSSVDVELKIYQLLGEIRLKVKEDNGSDVTDDPKLTLRCKRKTFKTFAIINSLRSSINEGVMDFSGLKQLDDLISLEKKEAQAEDEDLKKLPIPGLPASMVIEEPDDNRLEYFPYLMDLPELVLLEVLEYLTSASDKVNAAKAIPGAAALMSWNVPALQFEMILPILLKNQKQCDLEYRDLVKLAQVSDAFKDAINNYYESSLQTPRRLHDELHELKFPLIPEHVNLPIDLVPFWITLPSNDHREAFIPFLNKRPNIWLFDFENGDVDNILPLDAALVLQEYLPLMPNLRQLDILILPLEFPLDEDEGEEALQLNVPFPEAPNLLRLNIGGEMDHWLTSKLLREFGPGLEHLMIDPPGIPFHFPVGSFPNLTTLIIDLTTSNSNEGFNVDALNGSPVKYVEIVNHDLNPNRSLIAKLFEDVMVGVATNFESTLEEVLVELGMSGGDGEILGVMPRLANLVFPKVKILTIEDHPGSWTLPFHFPKLETLSVVDNDLGENSTDYFDCYRDLELSWDREKLCVSKVWKLLPLKSIKIYRKDPNNPVSQMSEVTRSQCLAFQRGLM